MAEYYAHLQCSDLHAEHVVRVVLLTAKGEHPELIVEPLLNQHIPFLRRLWVALLYVFGIKSNNYFAEVILDDRSVDQLTSIIAKRNLIVKLRDALEKKKRRKEQLKNTGR